MTRPPHVSAWPLAVFFDFDGVLVNSEPVHFRAFQQVLAAHNVSLSEGEYYRDLIGFDDKGAFRHLYATRDLPLSADQFAKLLMEKCQAVEQLIERRHFSALPGAQALVRLLSRRCPLAICSGALRDEIQRMLDAIDLREHFPIIVAAEDVTIGKPDPQGYLLTLKQMASRLGVDLQPADCLIIEDAPTVIASVRSVGFPVMAVATSYPPDKLTEANWVVKSLEPAEVAKAVAPLNLEF